MIIELPDQDAGFLIYALRPYAFKDESEGIKQRADKLRTSVGLQIEESLKRKHADSERTLIAV